MPGNGQSGWVPQRPATVLILALSMFATLIAPGVAAQSAPPRASRPATLEVTDETGRTIRVPQPVRRIVSLAPNLTETLFALGLGDRVVGDTNYCDYPAEALSKAHVGGPVNPSIEEIAALHPDLVLATRAINQLATVRSIQQLGIAVYATDPRSVEQVLSSTEHLGRLLGAEERAAAVVADLRGRLEALRARLSGSEPKVVLFVTWVDPLISVGRDTFLADALRWAGARTVVDARQDWPNVSLELVVRLQPQYLVFSSDQREQIEHQIAELRGRPGWRDLEALRGDRIIILSEAFSRPAPRLVDTIEQLARALHPERFAADGPATLRAPARVSPIHSSAAAGAL